MTYINFAEFLFGVVPAAGRPENDPVRRLSESYKNDISWPTGAVTIEDVLRYVIANQWRRYFIYSEKIAEEILTGKQPNASLQDYLSPVVIAASNRISELCYTLRMAWADYQEFLRGQDQFKPESPAESSPAVENQQQPGEVIHVDTTAT